jgi:hypothetical protein
VVEAVNGLLAHDHHAVRFERRHAAGGIPNSRLNARLNAASDS